MSKKGFAQIDSHHKMFWLYVDGKKTGIRTRISQGEKTLDDYLIGCMSKQMRLTKKEFTSFVDCTMSGADYQAKMLKGGHVRP